MEALFQFLKRFDRYTKNTDLFVAFGLIAILAVMIIPLPAFLLDLGLTFSITFSLLILLIAMYTSRALDFSVFPTLLLLSVLLRLSLNVATTRLILTEGHSGPASAGHVIEAFASVVVGNNYFVGFVVFVIL